MKTTQLFTALMAVVVSMVFASSAFAFEGIRLTGLPEYSGGSVPVDGNVGKTCLPSIPANPPVAKGDKGETGNKGDSGPVGAEGQPGQPGTNGTPGGAGAPGQPGGRGYTGKSGGRGPGGPAGQAGKNGQNADSTGIYHEIKDWNVASKGDVATQVQIGVGQAETYAYGLASGLQNQINTAKSGGSNADDDSTQKGPKKMDYTGLYWLAGLGLFGFLVVTIVWISMGSADRRANAETAAINAAADRRRDENREDRLVREAREAAIERDRLTVAGQLVGNQFDQVQRGLVVNKVTLNGLGSFSSKSDTRNYSRTWREAELVEPGFFVRRDRREREAAAEEPATPLEPAAI